ncbi:hypothetical protein ACSAZK_06880 [Methanosarcina sp. Mfa9]|uniref:hypothetical protein n=1 Tax=Methanosarcina sp. Mfa9 TaxID=3439063 RepID=UPI003F859237
MKCSGNLIYNTVEAVSAPESILGYEPALAYSSRKVFFRVSAVNASSVGYGVGAASPCSMPGVRNWFPG